MGNRSGNVGNLGWNVENRGGNARNLVGNVGNTGNGGEGGIRFGMMGTQVIRVEMRGREVTMQGIRVEIRAVELKYKIQNKSL